MVSRAMLPVAFFHVLRYKEWPVVAMRAIVVTAGVSSLIELLVGQLADKGVYEIDCYIGLRWVYRSLLIVSLAYCLSYFNQLPWFV